MKHLVRAVNFIIFTAAACCWWPVAVSGRYWLIAIIAPLFLLAGICPSFADRNPRGFLLRVCADGCELLCLFLASATAAVGWHIYAALSLLPEDSSTFLISGAVAVVVEALVFWNGILRVYCASGQLGVRWRVIGIVCGWIPIANLWALISIIRIVRREISFESDKRRLNESRAAEKLCATKYPILLVHGVCFRDSKLFNYWGRIPAELKRNGAEVFYGEHQSARAVEDSAREIAERIKYIVNTTGCEKVNIIAHSKGGLDSRYAVSVLDAAPFVASITTVNTPHRGCIYADYLLGKIPESTQLSVAEKYNAAARKLGDINPDFLAAMRDLTASRCIERNSTVTDVPDIYYQSIGSILDGALKTRFPMSLSFPLVKHFDGRNDGLVSESSFPWGERYECIEVKTRPGVSHMEIIDLGRENVPDFDVREFYVQLVSDLRQRGF